MAGLLGLALLAGCKGGVEKADAYEALADTLYANKAYPAAIEALDKATRYDGNEPRRWLKLGRTWRALRNPALSAVSYQRALDLDPANVEALQNLSVLLVRSGQYDDAKRYITPLLTLSPDDPGGLLANGAVAFFEKRYAEADRIASRLIEVMPDLSDGYILRAKVLEAQGRRDRATALLAERLAIDSDNQELATQLLALYRGSGDIAGIRRTALILARLDPDNIPYQLEAARAYHALGQEEAAREVLAALAARYVGSPGVQQAVAEYWLATLPRDQAIARIAEMATKVHGRVRARLAQTLVRLGRARDALAVLGPEVAGPVDAGTIEAHGEYARALLADGQVDAADAKARQVIAYDANDAATLVQAQIAFRRRRYADALNGAQVVFDRDPDNAEAALLIPKVYEAQGKPILARKAYADAQSAMPANLGVAHAHAEWLATHGAPDDAVAVARQFAQRNGGRAEARAYVEDLCGRLRTAACRIAAANPRDLT